MKETTMQLLKDAAGCFDAAAIEGLRERLAELPEDVGSIRDLVERRILHAHDAILRAMNALDADYHDTRLREADNQRLQGELDCVREELRLFRQERSEALEVAQRRVATLSNDLATQSLQVCEQQRELRMLLDIVADRTAQVRRLKDEADAGADHALKWARERLAAIHARIVEAMDKYSFHNDGVTFIRSLEILARDRSEGAELPPLPLPPDQFAAMRDAFVTCESIGSPEKRYQLVFRFPTLIRLQKAHREWIDFTTTKENPCS